MKKVDTTLFTKKIGKDLFVLQIYVDDIIFGSTNQDFCEEFRKIMANEFEISMISELSYFYYYKLIYHCHHFQCRSDRSDGVILAPSDRLTIDAAVVLRLHFLRHMKSRANWDTHFARRP
jgi:hypothetical protein